MTILSLIISGSVIWDIPAVTQNINNMNVAKVLSFFTIRVLSNYIEN
jgi:cytochrome b subunit of formate dehydrogenase